MRTRKLTAGGDKRQQQEEQTRLPDQDAGKSSAVVSVQTPGTPPSQLPLPHRRKALKQQSSDLLETSPHALAMPLTFSSLGFTALS